MRDHSQIDTGLPYSFTPDVKMDSTQTTLWAPAMPYATKDVMSYFLELSVVMEPTDYVYYEVLPCNWNQTNIKAVTYCTRDRLDITPHVAMLLKLKCIDYNGNITIPYKVIGKDDACPRALVKNLAYHVFGAAHMYGLRPMSMNYFSDK